jgi:hypothetical protein
VAGKGLFDRNAEGTRESEGSIEVELNGLLVLLRCMLSFHRPLSNGCGELVCISGRNRCRREDTNMWGIFSATLPNYVLRRDS